ncbi:MAG: GGDEF domain-containing protein [Bacillota bacterium]|nr:GGDEF domain-containing protein [Bacillota bacterium]
MGDRQTSRTTSLARLAVWTASLGLLAALVPAARKPETAFLWLFALCYSGAVLLSVRLLRREQLRLWLAASALLDFGALAAAQALFPVPYFQPGYLFAFIFYAIALGRRRALALGVLPAALAVAVDMAAGRPSLLPLDASLALVLLLTGWALGTLSDERRRLQQALAASALTDELTGLANRRHLFQRLRQELQRSARTGRPTSLALFDADAFKQVNDRVGHPAGDRVLAAAGRAMLHAVRLSDLPARYGGDEFALLLPETDENSARAVAERVAARMSQAANAEVARLAQAGSRTPGRSGGETAAAAQPAPPLPSLGFTFGVAESRGAMTAEELLALVDGRLYGRKPLRGEPHDPAGR